MAKFVALKETVLKGKLIAAGEVVDGDDLAKDQPFLFRKATAAESLSKAAVSESDGNKDIDKIVAAVKKQVLAEVKDELLAKIKAEIIEELKPEPEADDNSKDGK